MILCEVKLWDRLVGAMAYAPDSQYATFEFDPDFLTEGIDIAPLKMPIAQNSIIYTFPGLPYETFKGLPAVFADTLPDDFGNAVINAWLAREGRDIGSFTPLERLLYVGTRSMGAFEYHPAMKTKIKTADSLQLDSLVNLAQSVLDSRENLEGRIDTGDDALGDIIQVSTSAGGARAKALIAINKERTIIKSGQVDAPDGFDHYLLKFDGVREHNQGKETFGDPMGFGRMEYAYYLMAKDAGITISDSELLMDGKRAHFLTKRFDRQGNTKLLYQSLCAMDHADFKKPGMYSYEQLFGVMRQLKMEREEAIELYRRMAFNVVARNHDDHTKNFGFILTGPDSKWQLAPAFDIAYSYKPGSDWVNAHQLTLNGKRDHFTRSDILEVGQKMIGNFKQKDAEKILDEVVSVVSEWDSYSRIAGVFDDLSSTIKSNLRFNITQ